MEQSMNYRFLLLDADDTLFDFQTAEARALKAAMLADHKEYKEEYLPVYSSINLALWKQLELGEVTKAQLQRLRFERFYAKIGMPGDSENVRRLYPEKLGEQGILLPGAMELVQELSRTRQLYLVTNGMEAIQRNRLRHSGLLPYLRGVFISEVIGVPKPQKAFFDAVAKEIPGYEREQVLLIGDSLTSDMRGGVNAGVDTCWYNAKGEPNNTEVCPTYEVKNYEEFRQLLVF